MNDTNAQGRNQELIDAYKSGMTMAELGQKFGITRQRVSQIFKRHGVYVAPSRRGRKPVDQETTQKYVAEAVKFGSKVKAAETFGVSPDTIGRALRRAGVSLKVGKFSDEKVKGDIIRRYESGERLREIAESYGTRAQHVNTLLRKWGVEAKRAALWKRGTLNISQG
jgi:Mor family transcriptional regulator